MRCDNARILRRRRKKKHSRAHTNTHVTYINKLLSRMKSVARVFLSVSFPSFYFTLVRPFHSWVWFHKEYTCEGTQQRQKKIQWFAHSTRVLENCWLRWIYLDTVNHTLKIPRRHMHTHTLPFSLLLLNTTQNLRLHNRQFEVVARVCLTLYACHIAVSFHLIYLFNRPNWKCESSFDMKINRNLTKTNTKMC